MLDRIQTSDTNTLDPVKAALPDLTDAELESPMAAPYDVPKVTYGLLIWIEGTCDLEQNRGRGFDYTLPPPEAAIDPTEDAVRIDAAIAMRDQFAQDSPAVLALLDALLLVLTGSGRKQ